MMIPDHFLEAIGGDVGSCVLVVGAGLSKEGVRRGGAGIPDWDQLMQLMVTHLEKTGRRDKVELEHLREMLKEDPPRYLDVAETFLNAHADDQDGYELFLRHHLMPNDLVVSPLHKQILSIGFRGIVSYNFDMVFEDQSDKLAPIVYPELMEQIGHLQRRGFFAKIHGCISRPASRLVLTRSGYDEIRLHPNYSNLITTVLFAHKVLCVGFSLRDPAFQSIIADLKDRWGEVLPPLFALMRNPDEAERAAWLKKGVDILPYDRHNEITGFFTDLAALSTPPRRRADPGVFARATKKRAKRARSEFSGRSGRVEAANSDIVLILEEWEHEQKVEEMDSVLAGYLAKLRAIPDKEALLFQLAALCKLNQAPHLCRQLIALDSSRCDELAAKIIQVAAESDNLRILTPHRLHVPLHRWLMTQEEWKFASGFNGKAAKHILTWLLDEAWGAQGVDLWTTFLAILTRMKSTFSRHGLDDLYTVVAHIPGAASEIEKIINSKDFIREDDKERRWYKTWDQQIVENIRFEKFQSLFAGSDRPPAEMLTESFALEAALPERVYRPYTEIVIARLLDAFVHRTHLTLHSSSDSYNPARAGEILDAFAGLRIPKQQLSVLWAINHWPERMRGLISLGDDTASLRNGLFVPLWWRYSSETRIEYLRGHRRGLAAHPERTGQELLLEDIMGLQYDLDRDFRDTFNLSLDRYQDSARPGHYEPRPLQELWSEQELRYQLVDECPPELVRRIAVRRIDWENSQSAAVRWAEANERAVQVFSEGQNLELYVSTQRADYVIDNLLGAYFPAHRRIALYTKMINYAADDLGVDADALMTVVYAHETVHAFSHVGRDLNGRMWNGFALPLADSPDSQPNKPHEALAQFYTFKLLEHINDKRLMDVFLALEKSSDPIYRVWRQTDHFSLEAMRQILIRYRNGDSEWPPDLSVK
jgi:hypothetical protein